MFCLGTILVKCLTENDYIYEFWCQSQSDGWVRDSFYGCDLLYCYSIISIKQCAEFLL